MTKEIEISLLHFKGADVTSSHDLTVRLEQTQRPPKVSMAE